MTAHGQAGIVAFVAGLVTIDHSITIEMAVAIVLTATVIAATILILGRVR